MLRVLNLLMAVEVGERINAIYSIRGSRAVIGLEDKVDHPSARPSRIRLDPFDRGEQQELEKRTHFNIRLTSSYSAGNLLIVCGSLIMFFTDYARPV